MNDPLFADAQRKIDVRFLLNYDISEIRTTVEKLKCARDGIVELEQAALSMKEIFDKLIDATVLAEKESPGILAKCFDMEYTLDLNSGEYTEENIRKILGSTVGDYHSRMSLLVQGIDIHLKYVTLFSALISLSTGWLPNT